MLWIAGTGVGVGKTQVARALLKRLEALGHQPIPIKPIETGCAYDERHDLIGRDGAALREACTAEVPPLLVSPYRLAPHLAPALALSKAGLGLDLSDLQEAIARLLSYGSLIVVEGPWGALTPMTDDGLALDLAERVGATVLVVGSDHRDAPGHVLGILEGCRRRAINIGGVLLNRLGPGESENAALIKERGGATVFETIPHLAEGLDDHLLEHFQAHRIAERLLDALGRP